MTLPTRLLACASVLAAAASATATPLSYAVHGPGSCVPAQALSGGGAPIALWPAGRVPGERPGAIPGNETAHCLTPGVPVAACKDLMITDVTVPTLTPYPVAGATAAMLVAPGGGCVRCIVQLFLAQTSIRSISSVGLLTHALLLSLLFYLLRIGAW